MHRIERITIKGLRRLHEVDIEMRPLMVMIGANGVGKTSFLDAISLLSASASGMLNRKLNESGGLTEVLTKGIAQELFLGARMSVPDHEPLQYELHLQSSGQRYKIPQEVLFQQRKGHSQPFKYIDSSDENICYYDIEQRNVNQPNWEHIFTETSLSQVPKMFPQPEEFRRILSSVIQYHVLDVGPRSPVKLPQQMKPANSPGENGEDLVPFLYNLRESDHDRFETIEDTLKTAFPGFENLNFPAVAAGMLSMTWKEANFREPIYMHQLSEGTLRFLWLASLLQTPEPPTITMIDEPEVSLHPELLRLLAELMREASDRTQIIVATHSDTFIRFLDPSEVMVMDIDEEGFCSPKWADSMDLEAWLEDYTLDEIWRRGIIGGLA